MRFWWWPEKQRGAKSNKKKLYHWGQQSAVITFISTGLLQGHWGKTSAELSVFAVDHRLLRAHRFFLFMTCQEKTAHFLPLSFENSWMILDEFLSGVKAFFCAYSFYFAFKYLNACLSRFDVSTTTANYPLFSVIKCAGGMDTCRL